MCIFWRIGVIDFAHTLMEDHYSLVTNTNGIAYSKCKSHKKGIRPNGIFLISIVAMLYFTPIPTSLFIGYE